jgi:hypothetical protein
VGSVWDRGIAVGLRQQNPTERGIDVGLRWDQCGINLGHMERYGSDVGLFRSASVVVSSRNSLGNFLVQRPSSMQGQFGFTSPHGPRIMCFSTKCLSLPSSGISAQTMLSTSAGVRGFDLSSNMSRMWACGRPLHMYMKKS